MNCTYMSPVTRSQQSTCHFRLAATDLCRIGFRGLSNLHEQLMSSAWQEVHWITGTTLQKVLAFFTEFPLKAMQNDMHHKLKFFLIQNVQMIST